MYLVGRDSFEQRGELSRFNDLPFDLDSCELTSRAALRRLKVWAQRRGCGRQGRRPPVRRRILPPTN